MSGSVLPDPAPLILRGQRFDASHPAVMAVINRTPDSFYSPARHTLDDALRRLDEVVDQGADIVDVGGVRAGQDGPEVTVAEEIDRVRPFLEQARRHHPEILLSLDTWRSEVARACAGLVDVINDTWAGADPQLVQVAAQLETGHVVSHTGGLPPRTDPHHVHYDNGVVADALTQLAAAAARDEAAGIPSERIIVDPTLDFGKTTADSLACVRATDRFVALGHPVLVAASRKDFVGETLDLPVDDRLEGTLATVAVSAWLGATVVRAHDIAATRRVVDMVAAIRGDRAPALSLRGV
ncbi:dihydropteroate synthase [Acidipropionibacterium acidipropionici]|uniref:Dihydropteroate synthase n=1 Tax=Acidipropionibacterium acidipropionici TaxID=1748 RepID=A0AAC8YGS5_9ACTN|nr:dihydropteroate synthase [Acidipropionibacterium acidipropionici]AMS06406.1 dihydropteroate synthase [Acidipropionibacterium acidipropionici]AOZ47856.1 dihydropteroate synthase [Acidipropionibacterium acidipropionici]AZP38800.1 dihydropteroate synthase [Acidipropionibacterium acidipropionici]QCV95763.1 dihydropteroate synthase [Acidipropionibacterium acidipropionici]